MAGQHPVQQTTHLWREHPRPTLDPHSCPLLLVRRMWGAPGVRDAEEPERLGPLSPAFCLMPSTPSIRPKDHVPGCGYPMRHWPRHPLLGFGHLSRGCRSPGLTSSLLGGSHQIPSVLTLPYITHCTKALPICL